MIRITNIIIYPESGTTVPSQNIPDLDNRRHINTYNAARRKDIKMPAINRRNNRDNNRTLSPYSRLVNVWDRTYETNLEYEEERDIKNELYNGVKNAISKIGTPLEVPHLDILNDDNTENMAFLVIENMRITRERYRGNLYH